jgi:hypothetical protein
MKLLNQLKISDLILWLFQLVPPYVVHNFGKANCLRMAFYHANLDSIPGCYAEFGVASGNSLRSAEIAERKSHSRMLGIEKVSRNLYGFDTFEGFASLATEDQHKVWSGTGFSFDFSKVQKRFKKNRDRVNIYKMNMSLLESDSTNLDLFIQDDYIAIALFDMDLGDPTFKTLKWIRPKLKSGTILIFDEFFGFKGDPDRGESKALCDFLRIYPEILTRELYRYGDGGVGFQITVQDKSI